MTQENWSRRSFFSAGACVASAFLSGRPAHAMGRGPEKILEEARSEFNHIQIGEQDGIRTMYFVHDRRRFIESRWDMNHPQSLDLDYSRTMMAGFLFQPKPKKIMMMGVGGGQISNYLFRRFPGIEIDAVDIDPEVIRLAQKYFAIPKSPRYRLHVGDGRVFIEESATSWDLMLLDAFRGVFVPYHLKTQEFYEACLGKLNPGGAIVANLHNAVKMYSNDRQTLEKVFPQRYAFVSEKGNQTTFVASADAQRVGIYRMRQNGKSVQDRFDFDIQGLAARHYSLCDWDRNAKVLRDDFSGDLDTAAARHNRTCIRDCKYQSR